MGRRATFLDHVDGREKVCFQDELLNVETTSKFDACQDSLQFFMQYWAGSQVTWECIYKSTLTVSDYSSTSSSPLCAMNDPSEFSMHQPARGHTTNIKVRMINGQVADASSRIAIDPPNFKYSCLYLSNQIKASITLVFKQLLIVVIPEG